MPGVTDASAKLTVFPTAPCDTTLTVALFPVASTGIWKLIWPVEVKNKGAGVPLMSTDVPPRIVGSGMLVAGVTVNARFEPNSEASDHGLTTAAVEKLAPFTTPFGTNTGAGMPATAPATFITRSF